METNDEETNYFSNEWIIDRNSKCLLCDQLAFLFFADTKTIFTEEEQEILNNIAEKMMKNKHDQFESVSVSLTLRCGKVKEDDDNEVWLPLFCFKKSSEEISFMDHKLKVHDKWVNTENNLACGDSVFIRSNNDNKSEKTMFICFPAHSSVGVLRFFQIDHVLDHKEAPTITELRDCFTDIPGKDLNDSWKTAHKLVRLLFQQFPINSDFVLNIINDLRTQVKVDVFDALLTGYREVTGEPREVLGNAYFIKDIQHILHYSNSFEKINTINSKLEILNGLTLHAKAFVQLKTEEKQVILYTDSNDKLFRYTISKYRFYFDEQLVEAQKRICTELGVQKLDDFMLNGMNILKDLKPFQIIRFYNILKTTCVDFNKTFIILGIELSSRLGVNRFEKLDAVMEYAATLLNEKVSEMKRRDRINSVEKRQRNRDRKENKDLRQNKSETTQKEAALTESDAMTEYFSQNELESENKNNHPRKNKEKCPRINMNKTIRDVRLNGKTVTLNREENTSGHNFIKGSARNLNENQSEIKTEVTGSNTEKQHEKNNSSKVRKPDKEVTPKAEAKPNETSHNLTKDELRCFRFEAAAKEIRENIELLCKTFEDLAAKYNEYSHGEKFNFSDPMLAASHYKKHGKEYKPEKLTFEKYLQMAREILSRNNIDSTWEQEGRVRSFKSEDKQKKIVAIRIDNTIATLFFS